MRLKLWTGAGSVALLLGMGWLAVGTGQEGRPEPPGLPALPAANQKPGAPDTKPAAPPVDTTKPGTPSAPKSPPADLPKDPPPTGTGTPPGGPTGFPPVGSGSLPAPLKVATGQAATINVQCLANATIWIEGQKMNSTGPVRSFQSPGLEPGKAFYYSVKVSWPTVVGQADQVMEQEVTVRSGQTTVLDFRPQQVQQPIMSQPYTSPPRFSVPGIRRSEGSGRRY